MLTTKCSYLGHVNTPPAIAGGFGLRLKAGSIGVRQINPLSHREHPKGGHKRVGERGSIQQTLLLDSYPLFLAFSRREKESFF